MPRLLQALALAALILLPVLSLDARFAGVRADDATDCIEGSGETVIRGCSQLIELLPKEVIAYYHRGIAYDAKGDYDRAIADFDKVIRITPTHAEAYYKRGIAYDNKGRFNRAIDNYNEAIKLNPKYATA